MLDALELEVSEIACLAVGEPAARPETATATAASTVALHVRKSLAEKSSPVASLRYSLMSGERTSVHERPFL